MIGAAAYKEAIEETKDLSLRLPPNEIYPIVKRFHAFLDKAEDPDDLEIRT
jgi:hypothetical protein